MKIYKMNDPQKISYGINGVKIPSRFFFAPINTGLSVGGNLSEEFFEFYRARSHTSIGINYIGNVAIDKKYITNENTAYFTDQIEQWKAIVSDIKKGGSIPGIQIACRNSPLKPVRKMINKNSEEYLHEIRKNLIEISNEEIEKIVKMFIDTSTKAIDMGFNVIQIHAAHGYFLSQLISKSLNFRKGKYNATDLMFLNEIVNGIREKRPKAILDMRISYLEGITEVEIEKSDKVKFLNQVAGMGLDIISFSNGIYDVNKQYIYPLEKWGHACFLDNIIYYANRYTNIIWNYAGNIWSIENLDLENLPSNLSFSLGRSLIADPLFVDKSFNGRSETVNKCEYKNKCHYYSINETHIGCPIYEYNK